MSIRFMYGDLFAAERGVLGPWTAVTTNGAVRSDGQAVMGRGMARQVRDGVPGAAARLGRHLRAEGNVPTYLMDGLVTLPTKHHWDQPADPELIRASTILLAQIVPPAVLVRFPKPGCGNGELQWSDVREWWLPLVASLFAASEVWAWRR